MERREFLQGIAALGATVALASLPKGGALNPAEASAAAAGGAGGLYEALCFKYAGPLSSSGALLTYMRDWDKTAQRNFYFWALRSRDAFVLVDCGVRPGYAAERRLAGYVSPTEMLARVGVKPADVRHLVLTHAHFDHVGGLELFPNATVYIQRREFDFWVYDPMAKRPPFAGLADATAIVRLAELRGGKRLRLIDGDQEILPGVQLLLTPGHTPGLQSVAAPAAGGLAVLASDSAHLRRNFELDVPSSLITDLPAMLTSMERLRARVGGDLMRLFTGHDVKLLEDYPKIAEDVTRLA
jgi:glyoxylase-like metal-dependent hydrolase (beta-lactamase superfamily II)